MLIQWLFLYVNVSIFDEVSLAHVTSKPYNASTFHGPNIIHDVQLQLVKLADHSCKWQHHNKDSITVATIFMAEEKGWSLIILFMLFEC